MVSRTPSIRFFQSVKIPRVGSQRPRYDPRWLSAGVRGYDEAWKGTAQIAHQLFIQDHYLFGKDAFKSSKAVPHYSGGGSGGVSLELVRCVRKPKYDFLQNRSLCLKYFSDWCTIAVESFRLFVPEREVCGFRVVCLVRY